MNEDISGGLENTRCSEIIKILSLGKQSGRLFLSNGGDTGNIFFRDGEIIHAQCGLMQGAKAIYEAAVWTSGEYRFYPDDTPDAATIDLSVDDILNETANRIRQMDRITSLISSSSAVYAHDPDIKEKEISLKSVQWKVLAHIDGRKSIADISQKVNLGVSDTMKVFYTLIKAGLLKESEASASQSSAGFVELPATPFIESLEKDLTRAIGPIAPFVIAETAQEMGYDLLSDDAGHKAELIETLSNKIPSEAMSLAFLDTMTDWINGEGA
jgi:hypothetical protein